MGLLHWLLQKKVLEVSHEQKTQFHIPVIISKKYELRNKMYFKNMNLKVYLYRNELRAVADIELYTSWNKKENTYGRLDITTEINLSKFYKNELKYYNKLLKEVAKEFNKDFEIRNRHGSILNYLYITDKNDKFELLLEDAYRHYT